MKQSMITLLSISLLSLMAIACDSPKDTPKARFSKSPDEAVENMEDSAEEVSEEIEDEFEDEFDDATDER